MSADITRHHYQDNGRGRCYECTLVEDHSIHALPAEVGEGCPDCDVPMITEDGLWYCAGCDAYHGEAGVQLSHTAIECSECGTPLAISATRGTPGMPSYDAAGGSKCPSGVGHLPQEALPNA